MPAQCFGGKTEFIFLLKLNRSSVMKKHSKFDCVLKKSKNFTGLSTVGFWRRERLPTPVFWPGEFHGLYRTIQYMCVCVCVCVCIYIYIFFLQHKTKLIFCQQVYRSVSDFLKHLTMFLCQYILLSFLRFLFGSVYVITSVEK